MRQTTALELALEEALGTWLPEQRWFAGKGNPITGLAITADTELAAGGEEEPALRHLIVKVTQRDSRSADSYQILVGLRADMPGRLEHARIGTTSDRRTAYDALYDHDLARMLLQGIVQQQVIGRVRFARVTGTSLDSDPVSRANTDSLVLTGEQSNTSLVFGEEAILKVFRRVAPGPNPDLEVNAALGRLGAQHIAEPLGWIELTGSDSNGGEQTTILAILSRYLRTASDGWSLAAISVRDLYARQTLGQDKVTIAADAGGDFAGEARRLGTATAEVHRDLMTAFGSRELPPGATAELAAAMRHRLEEALTAVPALREHAAMLTAAYDELAGLAEPVRVQRIHGDYHLGQVLRTDTGWVVLDFEGEPAVPLATRRDRFSPLRDVAGMLRSFDYAARHQLLGNPDRAALELPARDWVRRNRDAFCGGYAEAGADPRESGLLLRAFELDKAVYEVMYEVRNRPSWLPIPLDSLAALPVIASGSGAVDTP
jgi:maltokinase